MDQYGQKINRKDAMLPMAIGSVSPKTPGENNNGTIDPQLLQQRVKRVLDMLQVLVLIVQDN